jgi:hypothetical protein
MHAYVLMRVIVGITSGGILPGFGAGVKYTHLLYNWRVNMDNKTDFSYLKPLEEYIPHKRERGGRCFYDLQ